MICDYETTLTIDDVEYDIECEIAFTISGRYYPATHDSPAEFPELEIEEVEVTRMEYVDENDNVVSIECPESWVALVKKAIEKDERAQLACFDYFDNLKQNRD